MTTTTTTGSIRGGTSTKIAATTATAMTTESTRAGTNRRIAMTTGIGMTITTASGRGGLIRTGAMDTGEKNSSRGASISACGAWCSTTIRIGWLPPTTSIAAAIGNGTVTASMYTMTIITPAGTCSSMPVSDAPSTSNISACIREIEP